ncbi:hypothetical protein JK636_17210 [Clostridium sp. YIM B02515]|uniref:Uncharacterized protein n=1 Tax=Clostridium rhizosphaerae TaxID=2803861 RepID=A0ABS1TFD3_9CLOT|nr:hypothetical protein [Clostridium rhizosphaerae]MBL4937462.1 hypothetical protein [Clostridium rhizosphaerae]
MYDEEESFYATVKLIVKESNKKRIRLLENELMALGCVNEETGEDIIRATFCFKSI